MQIILQEIPVDQATYLSCRIDESRRNEIVKKSPVAVGETRAGTFFCLHRRLSAIYIQQYRYGEFLPIITGLCYNQFIPDTFGIFGITWYAVEQRKREIAIRKSTRCLFPTNSIVVESSVLLLYSDSRHDRYSYRICLDETVEGTVCVSCGLGIEVFIVPVVLLMLVTFVTVVLNGYHTALSNPAETIKTE